jgi:hypothetical protein
MSLLETVVNDIPRLLSWRRSMRNEREQRLHRFVLEALGTLSCIGEPANGERLSFRTIEYRIRLRHGEDPDYAEQCGVPGLDDPDRDEKIRTVLRGMQRKTLLRAHLLDRWSVA